MKVEIQNGEVHTKSGKIKNGDRAGQDYSIRTQEAWMFNGHTYPERFTLILPDSHAGYPPGLYELAPESFEVGEFGRPQLSRTLVLVRSAEAPKLTAAK